MFVGNSPTLCLTGSGVPNLIGVVMKKDRVGATAGATAASTFAHELHTRQLRNFRRAQEEGIPGVPKPGTDAFHIMNVRLQRAEWPDNVADYRSELRNWSKRGKSGPQPSLPLMPMVLPIMQRDAAQSWERFCKSNDEPTIWANKYCAEMCRSAKHESHSIVLLTACLGSPDFHSPFDEMIIDVVTREDPRGRNADDFPILGWCSEVLTASKASARLGERVVALKVQDIVEGGPARVVSKNGMNTGARGPVTKKKSMLGVVRAVK